MISAYWNAMVYFDLFIWICGLGMFASLMHLCIRRQHYSAKTLEKFRDSSLYFCEFFPLAGLLGTMLGLLATFSSMESGKPDIGVLFNNFAPALTSTISGLLMLILNLIANFFLGWAIKE